MIHRKIYRQFFIAIILLPVSVAFAQNLVLPNAYAHNDYWHKRPLLDALDNGFTYVEADVFLRHDKLIVAHFLPCLQKKRTLEDLYLKPLLNYVAGNSKNESFNNSGLTLMIDIKSDADKTYKELVLLLEKYSAILSSFKDGRLTIRNVTVIITGHKPANLISDADKRLAFMDEDLKRAGSDSSTNVYPMASCKYSSLLKWKGKGTISASDIQRLNYYVAEAHKKGRKVRLWGSPEKKMVWAELLKCNVDLINTNKLKALRNYLVSDLLLVAKKSQLL
ncbi:MAG: phosphatidylinositol-specific phospholipase C/glycerophosphodiester phosphodiesterase family protein [Ferruginibacter sp.]